MMREAKLGLLVLALLFIVLPACSMAGTGGGEGNVQVTVENNLIPPTSLSVYAVPEVGSRRLVGNVTPGQTSTLSFSGRTAEQYRFVAQTTAGQEIASNTITLGPGSAAIWDVSSNIVVPDGN
jgi:hypothetical protein